MVEKDDPDEVSAVEGKEGVGVLKRTPEALVEVESLLFHRSSLL